MIHVHRQYAKVPRDLVEAFRDLASATIYEAAGQTGMLDPGIKPVYPQARVCGTAVTVQCHVGDNLMLHKGVTVAGPGDVLVATIGEHVRAGAWGEILVTAAKARGITGLVIDGGVRDVEAIETHKFPVFARGICIGATMKKSIGKINHSIVCGGALINPGDLIVGDRDGVVVVPKERAQEILDESLAREAREAVLMEKLRGKAVTTLELLNLEVVLKNAGLVQEGEG
jgi:4-hydroxy-4-methyl-2-oxoglutarate aldolase